MKTGKQSIQTFMRAARVETLNEYFMFVFLFVFFFLLLHGPGKQGKTSKNYGFVIIGRTAKKLKLIKH